MTRPLDRGRWKRRALKVGGTLAVLGVVGLLVAASGVIPIRASSGHWPITRWFLEFSMRRSVETHTLGSRVPDLEDPALVHRGAGHYALGCEPCHGSPGRPPTAVAQGMTPRPPWLPDEVTRWSPADLHYIVRHGIKFTGMPAWPAPARDDEVWAVVAFLQLLPTLDTASYRRLALGETAEGPGGGPAAEPPPAVTGSCARCHAVDGLGRRVGAFPRLAGQSRAYMEASLRAYARGERHSGIMEPVAAALSATEIELVTAWYADGVAQARAGPAADAAEPAASPASVEAGQGRLPSHPPDPARGETIARSGVPARKVPSCVHCHGPGPEPRHPLYPSLAGQYADYLVLQLRLFRDGRRGGSSFSHVMGEVSHHLGMREMADVAAWYASLDPDSTGGFR